MILFLLSAFFKQGGIVTPPLDPRIFHDCFSHPTRDLAHRYGDLHHPSRHKRRAQLAIADFFADILAMTWPGQFNFDFFGFLILSATWTAWRNQFSAPGLGLALVALFGGIPFLTTYLLYLSYQTSGDIRVMLLGEGRS